MRRLPCFCLLASLTACGSGATKPTATADALEGAYPAPLVATEGKTVATVGEVDFTSGEFERRLRDETPFLRQRLADPEQMKIWVENQVRHEAIAQRAWAEGLQNKPEVREAFRALLVKAYTEEAMRKLGSLEPNEKELLEAYETRDAEFNQPAKVRLSHLVRYVDSKKEREAARKLLEDVRARVIAGQKKNDHTVFSKAVREHTQDEATRVAAGDLQFLTREQLSKRYGDEVAKACFDEASVGDLFIADAPNAVVLFKKTGFRRAIERSFSEVRSQLRLLIHQDKRKAAVEAWTADLFQASKVDLDPEGLAEIQVPAATPATGEDH